MVIQTERNYWDWANYCEAKMHPCPFCGGEGKYNVDHVLGALVYIVYCSKCGIKKRFGESSLIGRMKMSEQQIYRSLSAKALRFWNKRATQ